MKHSKALLKFMFPMFILLTMFTWGCKKQSDDTSQTVLPKKVEVYAHRGARSYAPENSIPGYATGLAIGTHWVDMDIVMSKDGQLLYRTT